MRLTVQTDNLVSFKEALRSRCDGVRLGSEFCESLLPDAHELMEARELAGQAKKEFTYITPRVSEAGMERLKAQLRLLNDQDESDGVVFNDLGILNVLSRHANLRPHLGRHLLSIPARTLWQAVDAHMRREDLSLRRREWLRTFFSATSLDYGPTIALYRSYGCWRADLDWVPSTFPSFASLSEQGLRLSVHLYLFAATYTRKCHMARFVGEANLETCSKPCLDRAFLLRNDPLDLVLYLQGNAAFRRVEPCASEIKQLEELGVYELVLPMGPVAGIQSAQEIDRAMAALEL